MSTIKNKISSFFKKVSDLHSKLSHKHKELDSMLTIMGVMIFGVLVMFLCNSGDSNRAESQVKLSITDNKAEEYYYEGDYTKAIEEYMTMNEGEEWPYYEAKMAESYSVNGDIERSNQLLDEVIKKRVTLMGKDGNDMYKDKDAELGRVVSYVAFINGNPRMKEYAECFYKDNKDDFSMNVILFAIYLANGDTDDALEVLKYAESISDSSAYELAVLSKMYITVDKYDRGLDLLEEAWNIDKNDIKVYDLITEITTSDIANLKEQIEAREVIEDDEECYKAWLLNAYSKDYKDKEKFDSLKEEVDAEDTNFYMDDLILEGFFSGINTEETKGIINKLIEKDDRTYSEDNLIARYYMNDKKYNDAINYISKSINSNRSYEGNYTYMVPKVMKEIKSKVRMEPYYRQGIAYEPYNSDTIMALAGYYKDILSDYEKAYSFYELATKIEPTNSQIVYDMALVKIEQKKIDEAEELLNKCLSLNPEVPKYYRTMAKAKYESGEDEDVIDLIRKAYNIDKNNIKTLNNAGCYYITSGENFDRGYYNLKCAYEGLKDSDDIDTRRIITNNYEAAKAIKDSDIEYSKANKMSFELFY